MIRAAQQMVLSTAAKIKWRTLSESDVKCRVSRQNIAVIFSFARRSFEPQLFLIESIGPTTFLVTDSMTHPSLQLYSRTKCASTSNSSSIVARPKKYAKYDDVNCAKRQPLIHWVARVDACRFRFNKFRKNIFFYIFPSNFPVCPHISGLKCWRWWIWITGAHLTSHLFNDRSRHCVHVCSSLCEVWVRVEKFGGNRFMCQFELLSK